MHYFVMYNITGKGHDRMLNEVYTSNSGANAFKKAVKEAQESNPSLNIDTFWAFYIVPCSKDFTLKKWDKKKMHGWDQGGKISYPIQRGVKCTTL